jgi:hypothetical protein
VRKALEASVDATTGEAALSAETSQRIMDQVAAATGPGFRAGMRYLLKSGSYPKAWHEKRPIRM